MSPLPSICFLLLGLPRKTSLVAWNCRGVGSPSAVPNLQYQVRHFNPDLLFLSETLAPQNIIFDIETFSKSILIN